MKAIGCRVLIRPDRVAERTSGGLFVPDTVRSTHQAAAITGTVVDMGPRCSPDYVDGVSIGDRVYYAKYSGFKLRPDDDESEVMVNDQDLVGLAD